MDWSDLAATITMTATLCVSIWWLIKGESYED